jgi:hypothetical protein
MALYEYWSFCPPTHLLVRGFFKIAPKSKIAKQQDEGDLGTLMADLEAAGFSR